MAIRVLASGGTIASLPDPVTGAVRPAVAADDLVRSVPQLEEHGPVTVEEVARVNGWNVTPATMLELASRAREALRDDAVDGVVITHGTDTVEETAFLCDLLVDSPKPVAFAAAMRSGDELAADGPRNLLAAARVAGSPSARGHGAVLVMNDEIHAARWVRKLDSFRTSAFASPGRGPVGVLAAGEVTLGPPPPRVTVEPPDAFEAAVPIVQTYTGMEDELIESVLETTGASGLVLEGTGLGNVPGSALPGIEAAIGRGIPVVVATRTPTGGTGAVYGGPGGGVTLRDMGVLPAARLSAAKARLLLMALLATDGSADRFAATAEGLA